MNSESIKAQCGDIDVLNHTLLSGCNVCGRNHSTEECSFLRELKPVQDTKAPSRARLTLPANLEVQNLADNSTTVVARAPFPRNVQFGPFVAKHTRMLNPAVNFPLRVFGDGEEPTYYLDTSDEESCNWMCLVAPATSCKDQNLICYQMELSIFFTAIKDIQPGEQLKVWYAPYYAVKMGVVPFTMDLVPNMKKENCEEAKQKQKDKRHKNLNGMLLSREVTEKLALQLPAKQLGARQVPDRWRCKLCSAEEVSVVTFAKHLMTHYKRSLTTQGDKLLSCHICHRKFPNEKMLVKHKVVRHKVKIQRPRLLENVEEEERTDLDETDEDEQENAGMTSIVIANLTPQFSQNGAQTIFVTNSNQVFPDGEVNDSQNEALNVLLEQLQSEGAFTAQLETSANTDTSKVDTNSNELLEQFHSDGTFTAQLETPVNSDATKGNTESDGLLEQFHSDGAFGAHLETPVNSDDPKDSTNPNGLLEQLHSEEAFTTQLDASSNTTATKDNTSSDGLLEQFHSEEVFTAQLEPPVNTVISKDSNGLLEEFQSESSFNADLETPTINNVPKANSNSDILNLNAHPSSANFVSDIGNDLLTKIQDEVLHSESSQTETQDGNNEFLKTLHPCADQDGKDEQESSLLNLISCSELGDQDVGPPYNCDICSKEFHKADYLYRHLRKHTGEFTCVSCLAVFARKEGLVNHACFVDNNTQPETKTSRTCPYCQKVFRLKKLLKRHLAKHTGEWKCNSCLRIYSSRATLVAHKCTSKKTAQMYHCQVCSREFLRHNYLVKHMLLHRELHPCATCGRKLPAGDALKVHQDYCSQEKLLETAREATCPNCSATFVHVLTYRQHVLEHTHPIPCEQCGRRFPTSESKALHSCTNKMLLCDLCLKSFSHMSELVQHNAAHGVPQFHCYECGNSYHHSESYVNHVCNTEDEAGRKKQQTKRKEVEDDSAGFVCDVCGDIYKTIHSLKSHRQLHGERRFECELCGKRFHRKDILQEHHTVHQAPQIPCPVCNKKLKTKKSLDVHMRCHTGQKRYSCGECGKEFFQKGNLLKHAAIHSPVAKRMLTCGHCNKTFTSRDYLSQHMLEHTQGRIHQCAQCDKSFIKEHMLKAHIRQYHGGLTFVCPYCHMSVRYRQSMRRHLEKRHPDMQHEWDVQGFLDKLTAGGSTVATSQQSTIDIQTEQGGEILLTVSRIPLVEGEEHEEATDIGSQMELETEVQADEVPVSNAFIFNGTVTQEDEGNILLYVLDTGDVAIEPGY